MVYCGATKVSSDSSDDTSEEIRQIEKVVDILGNQLKMRVSMFTSNEDAQERERIKDSFAEGKMLQALVAIKCLDEGVNIPGIRTAFILASSTNPKEYVQRRGRVLRKADGKDYAVIYDFITLPRPLDSQPPSANRDYELTLFKREKERLDDFVRLCENPSESYKLVDEEKLKKLQLRIYRLERENYKTKKFKDNEVVEKIIKLISQEVDNVN